MPKTLSTDLRERIVRHVGEGHLRRSAAEKFAVSPSSAVRIVARHAATGSVAAKVGRVGRRSKLDAHRDYLVRRIAEAADITMPELAAELAARGVGIDPSNLSRWFIRNGYRFKKKRCWPASKIDPTSGKRAMNGWPSVSRRCGSNDTGSSSLTRPAPAPR
jgi:transposase